MLELKLFLCVLGYSGTLAVEADSVSKARSEIIFKLHFCMFNHLISLSFLPPPPPMLKPSLHSLINVVQNVLSKMPVRFLKTRLHSWFISDTYGMF